MRLTCHANGLEREATTLSCLNARYWKTEKTLQGFHVWAPPEEAGVIYMSPQRHKAMAICVIVSFCQAFKVARVCCLCCDFYSAEDSRQRNISQILLSSLSFGSYVCLSSSFFQKQFYGLQLQEIPLQQSMQPVRVWKTLQLLQSFS